MRNTYSSFHIKNTMTHEGSDGNTHDALSDIQAFVFLLGRSRNKNCKGEDCLERKKQKRVTLRMLCSETIEQLSETI